MTSIYPPSFLPKGRPAWPRLYDAVLPQYLYIALRENFLMLDADIEFGTACLGATAIY